MQLPHETAHYSKRVDFGDYVSRRLVRKRLSVLADGLTKATDLVLAAGRAVEDASRPIQRAMADRDAADDSLDETAQNARNTLAGRSLDAQRSEPYTLIFHKGIAYYTAATLDEEEPRYGELKQRLEEHLPDSDEVRKAAVPAITAGLADFASSKAALTDARTAKAMAETRLAAATEAWERQVEKTYGELVKLYGRAKADRFFPRSASRKPRSGEGPRRG